MQALLKATLLLLTTATRLVSVTTEALPADIKVTWPTADLGAFKKYEDFTVIITEKGTATKTKRNAISDSADLWPDAIMPYAISNHFTSKEHSVIVKAMQHWENCTCIRFRERSVEDQYYVMIMKGEFRECRSFLGRIHISFQPQGLLLGPGCVQFAVIVHEIGHALGFYHEHQRVDRDKYIRIFDDNIRAGFETEFVPIPESEATTLGIGYDYASIQHYGSNIFAQPNKETINSWDPTIPFGNAEELSPLDAAKTNQLYKCSTIPARPSVLEHSFTEITLPSSVTCGKVINVTESGTFESFNYPTHFLNQDCAYVFVAPEGYAVYVQFISFLLDPTPGCTGDYVQIYDGCSTSSQDLYLYFGYTEGRICNREDSIYRFPTSSNVITIYHHTDGRKTMSDTSGIQIRYTLSDINECLNTRCHQCINTPGSFECSCNDGYYYSAAAKTCYDVNECAINNGGCEHNCMNFGGGYRCTCKNGRFLQTDGKSCSSTAPIETPTNPPPGTIITKNSVGASTTRVPPTTHIPQTMPTDLPTTTVLIPKVTSNLPFTTLAPFITTATTPANIQSEQCGGGPLVHTSMTGSLQTKNYLTAAYPENIQCEWAIHCPEQSEIDISFSESFRVAGRMPTCPRSQLIISSCGIQYGPFCHLTPPTLFTTACNNVKVRFTSGSPVGITRTGFQLNYVCKPLATSLPPTTTPPPTTRPVTLPPTTLPPTTPPPTTPPATTLPPTTPPPTKPPPTTLPPTTQPPTTLPPTTPSPTTPPATTLPPTTPPPTTLPPTTQPPTTLPPTTQPLTTPPRTTLPPTTQPPTTLSPTTNPVSPSTPAPVQSPQCGGGLETLTTSTGSIQTLGYPNTAYPKNTNCNWDIQCPINYVIDLFFTSNFRLAGRMPECPRSQLILSGCGDTYGPYCHLTPPTPITTRCNAVKVTFTAGSIVGVSRTGFQLNYACRLDA